MTACTHSETSSSVSIATVFTDTPPLPPPPSYSVMEAKQRQRIQCSGTLTHFTIRPLPGWGATEEEGEEEEEEEDEVWGQDDCSLKREYPKDKTEERWNKWNTSTRPWFLFILFLSVCPSPQWSWWEEASPITTTHSKSKLFLQDAPTETAFPVGENGQKIVMTHRRVWWHTAPAAAAPEPTSLPPSASTASQGVGSIHPSNASSPLPRLLSSPSSPLPTLCLVI